MKTVEVLDKYKIYHDDIDCGIFVIYGLYGHRAKELFIDFIDELFQCEDFLKLGVFKEYELIRKHYIKWFVVVKNEERKKE